MSLLVILPSRGRPAQAAEAVRSFRETKALADTDITLVLHPSDPEFTHYDGIAPRSIYLHAKNLTEKLNAAAAEYAAEYDYIQFAADDLIYRTPGWDARITTLMREERLAFAYANDGARSDLANHVFADTRVVRALGWFALPTSKHLYLDDAWGTLGKAVGLIRYVPDVLIEHMHPFYGKAKMDASYEETNSAQRYDEDRAAFLEWVENRLPDDAETVRKAMA